MRFVYFGTPDFSRIILDELLARGLTPSLIVTAPDKPKGRHLEMAPSDVRVWAKAHTIPVITPASIDDEVIGRLRTEDADLFVVAAYGKILPERLLAISKHGTLNVHPSLLPKFRGASPIESAILSSETETGVSIMLLDALMDHGPVLAQKVVRVSPWPPKGSVLTGLLAHEGGTLLAEVMPLWVKGAATPTPQEHSKATFTTKIKKGDGEIDPKSDPAGAYKKIQAFDEWPGAFFFVARKNGERVRVVVKDASCTDGVLTVTRVVPEGKKEMPYEDFLRGL
jgi:methionyl-tRNA formyltransferase